MQNRKWQSVHREINLLSRALSFSFLIVVWIALGLVKFHLYGIAGWDHEWIVKHPTFWMKAGFFWRTHIAPYALFMLVGILSDYFLWPYFLKKENSLTFHYGE